MTSSVKRFIAGAVCPKCQLVDKLVVYSKDEQEICECVRCGYQQQQESAPQQGIAKVGQREHTVRIVRSKSKE